MKSSSFQISIATQANEAEILALNEAAVPHVSSLTAAKLASLREQSIYTGIARGSQGELVGFILVLDETAYYDSVNFGWFNQRYARFAYVDRIAIAPSFQRQGIGRKLYAAVINLIQGRYPTLACEVNLRPPNLISETFHAQLGFVEVGQQDTEGGAKRVVMLTQDIQA
ncbi:MAG: GNAT family N-acetyltransferase [SAR324 cluster bacterium]|nr:GNAT family N-acetyltransferase [SAR324 cluster bacterium]